MPPITQLPIVTLYRRDGIVQFNKAATRLIDTTHEGVDLLVPLRPEQPWKIDRRPGSPATLNYSPVRGAMFRAATRLFLLFVGQPTTVNSLKFELTPDADYADLFILKPLG